MSYTSANGGEPGTGGIKTPNTPNLIVSNVTFVRYHYPGTACLRSCSHCKVFQGGFQVSILLSLLCLSLIIFHVKVWFEKLTFLNSSLNKASFQWEHEVAPVISMANYGHALGTV